MNKIPYNHTTTTSCWSSKDMKTFVSMRGQTKCICCREVQLYLNVYFGSELVSYFIIDFQQVERLKKIKYLA